MGLSDAPRSIRTNNPGALNYGPFAQRYGAVGSDGRLAIFPDVETGRRAMSGLLDTYERQHGLNTVSGIINRWAPPNVDNNSTSLYIKTVASKLGVDPNAPLTAQHRPALMDAMAAYEAGTSNIPRQGSFASPGGGLSGASPPMALSNAYMPQQEQPGYLERVLNSPLFMMGASVLGAPNIGTGLMQGSQAASQNAMSRERLANERAMMPLKQMMLQAQLAQGQQQADIARETADMRRAEFAESQQMNPLKRQMLEAQIKALGQKDVLNEAIAQMIAPSGAAPAPSVVPSPIRPQSMQGAEPDPNLIRTQVGGQVQMPQQTEPDMVDTPMGRMTQQDAQRKGFALGLMGKGDAGKMLVDAAQQGKIGKEAGNQNDKDQMAAIESVARLDGIAKSFDPKHLEIPNRIEQQFRSLQNKAGGILGKPTPEQQQELMKFAQFKQQSVKNAALYVKYLSGVAVSEAEFARIMQTLPNAGTGMFDGDSAPEFAAKMQQAVKDSKAAIARANYLRTQGFKGKPWEAGVGIDDMPALIDQRGQIIEQNLRQQNPNADPRQIQEGVRRQLKQEFGI